MLVAFSSPVKFSRSVFSGVKFRAKFEVVLQKQFLSVDRCESLEIRLFYRKLSSRIARKFVKCIPQKIPSNTTTTKEVNSTTIDSCFT